MQSLHRQFCAAHSCSTRPQSTRCPYLVIRALYKQTKDCPATKMWTNWHIGQSTESRSKNSWSAKAWRFVCSAPSCCPRHSNVAEFDSVHLDTWAAQLRIVRDA